MTRWTPEMDQALLAARERGRVSRAVEGDDLSQIKVPSMEVALIYNSARPPVLITDDMARNRLKRLDDAAEQQHNRPIDQAHELPFEDIAVPQETFVGFRIAFFDIETTDLSAMMGRMLCWSIADNWGNIERANIYDFPQDSVIDDRGVTVALRDALERYDIIVGWNSKMFDQPMLNARLLRWGERPLTPKMHMDPMWTARAGSYGLRIGSSKLVNVSKFFDRGQGEEKTDIDWDTWAMAGAGDKAALAEVQGHCDQDVLVLRSVWNHMKPMVRTVHK